MNSFFEVAPIIGGLLSVVIFFSIPCFAEYQIHIPQWVGFVPIGSVFASAILYGIFMFIIDAIKRKIAR